jgi:hypothetical protein
VAQLRDGRGSEILRHIINAVRVQAESAVAAEPTCNIQISYNMGGSSVK